MNETENVDPKVSEELERAREHFREASATNEQLKLLLLVDPIQAFADAGVELSSRARKQIRHSYPGFAYGDSELYEAVKSGKQKIPWLKKVTIRSSRKLEKKEGR